MMNLSKICKLLFLILIVSILNACNNTEIVIDDTVIDDTIIDDDDDVIDDIIETYTVTLYNDEEIISVFDNLEIGDIVQLPVLDENDLLFVGWSIEDLIHNGEFIIDGASTLYAQFEVANEVFEYTEVQNDLNTTIIITGYTGAATYLKIPQMIDGKIVVSIGAHTFEESDIIEVSIPMDADVDAFAFLNSIHLKEVTFYGNFLIHEYKTIGNLKYDEMITQNSDTCVIDESISGQGLWTFNEGCPIIEVISINKPVLVDGVEYFSYNVILDKNFFPPRNPTSFGFAAFKGATALETVEIKKSDSLFFASAFIECPNITNLIIDEDSESFSLVDGILYNKDLTRLVYYPNGLEETSFTLPDHVESIVVDAFYENTILETIVIHKDYNGNFELWGLYNLNEIIVEENNQHFYTIDGVLFTDDILVKYPSAKTGSNYVIPENIKIIGRSSFIDNRYLETIDLGNEITRIYPYAFLESLLLTELNIPASCIYIDNYIVVDSSIDTLILNRSNINDDSITFLLNSLGRIDRDNFIIYVPDDSIDIYINNKFWEYYIDIIHPISEYTD